PGAAMGHAGPLEQLADARRPEEQVAEVVGGLVHAEILAAQLAERATGAHQPAEPSAVVRERPRRAEHHHVARRAEPDLHVREHGGEIPHDAVTTAAGSWYSCTHWEKTPPSVSRARTIWKNSGV